MSSPFHTGIDAATALAQLCCDQQSLPQGAPTSPIISNMICRSLDRDLDRYSATHKSKYTRYADDITFSTQMPQFPKSIAAASHDNGADARVRLADDLVSIFTRHSFKLNFDKIRISSSHERQTVTGLLVNNSPGIPAEWWKNLRAMIHAVEAYGLASASRTWKEKFDTRIRNSESPNIGLVINGKLMFARMVVGSRDPKYLRYANCWLGIGGDHVAETVRRDTVRLEASMDGNTTEYKYDLAVSFASDQEARVYDFFAAFEEAGLRVFFAPEQQRQGLFFGKDLPQELKKAFQSESRWCVIFASKEYIRKNWASFERQIIVDSFIQRGNRDYVLPVKFDDVQIDGLPDSLGHMSPADGDDEHIADVIVNRVRQES